MPVEDETEGRLSRWSKRKLAVAEETRAEEIAVVEDAELSEREAELIANKEAAEAVDLEALTDESDFSLFLKEGVPDLIKRKALATLWRTNPVFANVDGLVDYDDDFGSPSLNLKTFKSAYQAGRGYLEHVERLAKLETEESAKAVAAAEDKEGEEIDDAIETSAEESDSLDADELTPEADEEAAPIDESVAQAEPVELAEIEEAPRVSLRKRLELESEA